MNTNTTATGTNSVSSEVVVPALLRLASKTTAYTALSIVGALVMAAFAVSTSWDAARARVYELLAMVGLASLASMQARKRLQVGRILRLAKAGAHITMDGSELTATHNNVSHMMLLDVKTSYAINFPPANLKLPRATIVE
jgi:hypothetical protein